MLTRSSSSIVLFLAAFALFALAATVGCADDPHRGERTYKTTLVQYQNCNSLEADLKQVMIAEMETHFDQIADGGYYGGLEGDASAPSAGDDQGGREEGTDYSGTNNQETGVDEADFVKTDGYHVYTLNGNRLHIFGVPEFGDLIPESEYELEGTPRQMLINRDAERAVVFSQIYVSNLPAEHPLRALIGSEGDSGWYWRVPLISKLTVLDISDRTAPTLERELFFEGNYQTARMVDGSVRLAAYSWMHIPGIWDWWWYYEQSEYWIEFAKAQARYKINSLDLADIIPMIYERSPNGAFSTHSLSNASCRSFHRPTNSHGRGFASIISLDLFDDEFNYDADHVLTTWPTIYASTDYLYIAESAHDWWWFWWNEDHEDQLNLHMFDIQTPGETEYLGSGRVEGQLHNQFSLSENDGYLRVATTSNMWARWWLEDPPESENHLFVLDLIDGVLDEVGHVGGIAAGERIFAARMVGDRGYMVTFEQVDPLFTLDLSDPYDPRVVGELEIPGFSTYIHPIANDKLLTIGVGGDENGANWRTQISMFDVADFANPALSDVEALVMEGDSWGWSEAMYEHKAFQYWAPKGLLAIPLSTWDYSDDGYSYTSRLELVSVDPEGGALGHHGSIDHSHLFDTDAYWYYRDVRRSIFMGDYIYAISDRGISVHVTDDLTEVTEEPLPGYSPDDYWWWW